MSCKQPIDVTGGEDNCNPLLNVVAIAWMNGVAKLVRKIKVPKSSKSNKLIDCDPVGVTPVNVHRLGADDDDDDGDGCTTPDDEPRPDDGTTIVELDEPMTAEHVGNIAVI